MMIRSSLFRILLVLLVSQLGMVGANALPHLSIDLDSGRVLSAQQAFDPWHPASLTKLMTAYTAFRAIESGEITGNHPVRISKAARKQPPSRMGYRTGTTMTLDNALKLLVVKSANDVAVAIAESISGSVPEFSARMNREAAALGMTGSRFVNPHGLHDRQQVVTAHDMALLLQALHRRDRSKSELFATPSVLAPSRTKNGKTIQRIYYSYNLLLERMRGADGFKTGFVCASGYNFIGSATRSARRIAAIVLGRDSQTSRAVDAAKLIEEGFRQPLTFGTPLADLKTTGAVPTGPRNMRSTLCTPEARAVRYEPGAGQAVIKSPWLSERVVNKSPLVVALASPSSRPANLNRVPLPTFRPLGSAATITTVTTVAPPTAQDNAIEAIITNNQKIEPAPSTVSASIPLPTFRPAGS